MKKNSGYTLIELTSVLFFSSILITLAVTVYSGLLKDNYKKLHHQKILYQFNQWVNVLSKELDNAVLLQDKNCLHLQTLLNTQNIKYTASNFQEDKPVNFLEFYTPVNGRENQKVQYTLSKNLIENSLICLHLPTGNILENIEFIEFSPVFRENSSSFLNLIEIKIHVIFTNHLNIQRNIYLLR